MLNIPTLSLIYAQAQKLLGNFCPVFRGIFLCFTELLSENGYIRPYFMINATKYQNVGYLFLILNKHKSLENGLI